MVGVELDVVHVEEHAQPGTIAHGLGAVGVVVDDPVVVAVDARGSEVFVHVALVAGRVGDRLFHVAGELRQPSVADVHAVRGVPVVAHLRGRRTRVGPALPGVHDGEQADDDDTEDDCREQGAALEAHLLALAALGELGDLLGAG